MARKPLAKVRPMSDLTSIWLTPGRRYSTGSSMVMMRRLTALIALRKQ